MELNQIISPDMVLNAARASSKKQVIQSLAALLAKKYHLDETSVFTNLIEREKLGSTGVGRGVAIPHARIKGLPQIVGLFARLNTPINFDSIDQIPVDLVFMLLAGEDAGTDHLKALSKISRLLRDPKECARLRSAKDSASLYAILAKPSTVIV